MIRQPTTRRFHALGGAYCGQWPVGPQRASNPIQVGQATGLSLPWWDLSSNHLTMYMLGVTEAPPSQPPSLQLSLVLQAAQLCGAAELQLPHRSPYLGLGREVASGVTARDPAGLGLCAPRDMSGSGVPAFLRYGEASSSVLFMRVTNSGFFSNLPCARLRLAAWPRMLRSPALAWSAVMKPRLVTSNMPNMVSKSIWRRGGKRQTQFKRNSA